MIFTKKQVNKLKKKSRKEQARGVMEYILNPESDISNPTSRKSLTEFGDILKLIHTVNMSGDISESKNSSNVEFIEEILEGIEDRL